MIRTTIAASCAAALLLTTGCASNGTDEAATPSSSSSSSSSTGNYGGKTAEEVTPEPVVPDPSDFKIRLKIREKKCFGSAGCSITYQIAPTYEGSEDISEGSYDITYEVRGGEDGPQINTFTLEDGSASFDEEELIDTASSSKKLTARVTEVNPQ